MPERVTSSPSSFTSCPQRDTAFPPRHMKKQPNGRCRASVHVDKTEGWPRRTGVRIGHGAREPPEIVARPERTRQAGPERPRSFQLAGTSLAQGLGKRLPSNGNSLIELLSGIGSDFAVA